MRLQQVADVLTASARAHPDAIAVDQPGQRYTFADLEARAASIGHALQRDGIGSGDRVIWIGPNRGDFLALLYGADSIGAITVPLNTWLAPGEMRAIVADVEPSLVVLGEGCGHFESAAGPGVAVLGSGAAVDGRQTMDEWLHGVASTWLAREPDPDATALMLYTSGTTGTPKGIELTAANLAHGMGGVDHILNMRPGSVGLAPVPFFHVTGLGLALVSNLTGATILIRDTPSAPALLETLVDHQVTHMVAVPTVIQRLIEETAAARADWSALDLIAYGGAPMPPSVLATAIEVLGCRFYQGYGLSESTGGVTVLSPEDHLRATAGDTRLLGTVGRAVSSAGVRVVDPSTLVDLPAGEVGEVLIGGSHVMRGYWRQPSLTAETITPDGWLRTGDSGHLDVDGYLTLHDRIKDMIVTGGENVYPTEVENALLRHPAVADVAVVGVPSQQWGESPFAVVVRHGGQAPTGDELLTWLRDEIAHYKCPVAVAFVDALPRNVSGKLLKHVLRSTYRDAGT